MKVDNFRKLIREELINAIREKQQMKSQLSETTDEFTFVTPRVNLSYWPADDKYYATTGRKNSTVKWHFNYELRGWGSKGFHAVIDEIRCVITLEPSVEGVDEKELDMTFTNKDWKIKIEMNDIKLSDDIAPRDIDVNEKEKTIIVEF